MRRSLLTFGVGVQALPEFRRSAPAGTCPQFTNGTFEIDAYQLYPENADFDTKRCLLYTSVLLNASVAIYDPYKAELVDVVTFPGISGNDLLHVGGVAWDKYADKITTIADGGAAFNTNGANITGDNIVVRFDPDTYEIDWTLNLTTVTNGSYVGFQDLEYDSRGHIYLMGTFPSSLWRVNSDGSNITAWYLPSEYPASLPLPYGYSGVAAVGDILLVNDYNNGTNGEIYKFDMTADVGTPVLVPRTPNVTFAANDAIYLPPKYNGTVLLVATDAVGITVLRSKDASWDSAEHLGTIPNNSTLSTGSSSTAAVEIAGAIYMVLEFFTDTVVPGTLAGNRTEFPMIDITAQVESLLGSSSSNTTVVSTKSKCRRSS